MLMFILVSEALLFMHMKEQVESTMKKYEKGQPPSPAQLFTIANNPADGNMHFVQKVFKGPFEVWIYNTRPF